MNFYNSNCYLKPIEKSEFRTHLFYFSSPKYVFLLYQDLDWPLEILQNSGWDPGPSELSSPLFSAVGIIIPNHWLRFSQSPGLLFLLLPSFLLTLPSFPLFSLLSLFLLFFDWSIIFNNKMHRYQMYNSVSFGECNY